MDNHGPSAEKDKDEFRAGCSETESARGTHRLPSAAEVRCKFLEWSFAFTSPEVRKNVGLANGLEVTVEAHTSAE